MDIATASLHEHRMDFDEDIKHNEGVLVENHHDQPWIEHCDIDIAPDFGEMLDHNHLEGDFSPMNDFVTDTYPNQEAFAYLLNDPFSPRPSPGHDPLRPTFDPSHQPSNLLRPVGYEDKNDKRTRSTSKRRREQHPQQYITDWNAFTSSTTRSDSTSQQADSDLATVYNVRASNIDRELSDDKIKAFFNRQTHVEAFRSKTLARGKLVHLAISQDASWNDVLALDGYRLGRCRIKVEVDASGYSSDAE